MANKKTKLTVGDWAKWDGSDRSQGRPRYYQGQVLEVREHVAIIVDDEWHARSQVRLDRLEKIDAPADSASMTPEQCAEYLAIVSRGRS